MASYTQYWELNGSGPFKVNMTAGQSIIGPVDNKYYLTNTNSTSSSNLGTEVLVTDPNAVSSASSASTGPPNAVSSASTGPPNAVSSAALSAEPPNSSSSSSSASTGPPNAVSSVARPAEPPNVAPPPPPAPAPPPPPTLDSIIQTHLSKSKLPTPITTLFYFDAEFQAFNMGNTSATTAPFAHTPPSNGHVNATHFILNMGHICLELDRNEVSQSMSIAPLFRFDGAKFRDPTILLAKYIIANDGAWPYIDATLKIDLTSVGSFSHLPAELTHEHVMNPHNHKLEITGHQQLGSIELHKLFRRTPTVNSCLAGVASSTDAVVSLADAETDNTYPFLSELLRLYPDKADMFNDVLARTYELYMEHSFHAVNTKLSGNDANSYFEEQLRSLHERMSNPHTLLVCKGKTDLYAIYNTFQRYGFPVMGGELKCAFFDLDMPRLPMSPKVFPIMKLGIVSDLYKLRYGLTQFYDDMQYIYIENYLRHIGSTQIVAHNPLVDSLMHMMAHIGFSFDLHGNGMNNEYIFNMIQRLFGIPYSVAYPAPYALTPYDLTKISYGTKIVNGAVVFQNPAVVNKNATKPIERECLTATSYFMPPLRINIHDIYIDPESKNEFIIIHRGTTPTGFQTYIFKNRTRLDELYSIIYTLTSQNPPVFELNESLTAPNARIDIIRTMQENRKKRLEEGKTNAESGRVIPNEIHLLETRYTLLDGSPVDVTYIGKQIIRRNNGSPPEYIDIYFYNHYYYIVSRYAQDSLDLEPLKYGVEIIPPPAPPGPPGHPRRRKTRRQRRALKSRRRKSRKAQ